jgi:uncharacterized membrane protein
MNEPETASCAICGKVCAAASMIEGDQLRRGLFEMFREKHPDLPDDSLICRDDLRALRRDYVAHMLEDEVGDLDALDRKILESMDNAIPLTTLLPDPDKPATFGDGMADRVANFGGSWAFILSFMALLLVWTLLNVTGWLFRPFDAYPFILLNLVLSCIAALQAPVIMMSQRRQEARDRQRAQNDYVINLKSELEIRQLHDKMDHQMARQWQRLAEIQRIQIDLLEENGR